MRDKLFPIFGALAAGGLMILLFKPDAGGAAIRAVADRAPMAEIQMTGLNGAPWRLSDHRGKVVLVNFWASWCPPCREETPGLVRIANDYAGQVEIAGISLDEGAAEVHRFMALYKVPYTVMMPPPGDALSARIQSLPTTFLVDRQGRVAKTYLGAERELVIRQDIGHVLGES